MSVLVVHVLLAAAKTTPKSGSSAVTLIVIVGLMALAYFFFIRPRSQRQRQAREQLRAASVGDEISTIGGLVGTIVAEDGDRVTVSTGNGTELVFLRQAIGRKLTPQTGEPITDEPTSTLDEEPDRGESDKP